ncbi:MAG: GNAT family N-acetyltransferase [Rhizobiales bacterium]|nr:GNAT family N-acetyltransferase [Hyphomicrobiales bacterium]
MLSNATPHIRPPTPADAEALGGLVRALCVHQGDPTEHATTEAVLRDMISPGRAVDCLVAEEAGRLVGYVTFQSAYEAAHAARGLYVCDLFVSDEARGRGAGRRLLVAVAREVEARGLVYLWWVSKAWNSEAQAFYAGLGAMSEAVVAHAIHGEPLARLIGEG